MSLFSRITLVAATGTNLQLSIKEAGLIYDLITWVREYADLQCDRTDGVNCKNAGESFACGGCRGAKALSQVTAESK